MTDVEKTVPEEGNNQQNKNGEPQAVTPPAASVIPAALAPEAAKPESEHDIARILEEVKLPERRDFKAIADVQTPAPEAAILEEHIVKKSGTREQETAGDTKQNAQPEKSGPVNERSSAIVAPFRTLKDDLQTVVREQKISLVHAASLEEEKRHGQAHLAPEQREIKAHASRRMVGILFATGILLFLGVGAIAGVLLVAQEQQSIPPSPQSSILFAEQTLSFALDNQAAANLKNELAQARTKQLGSLGSITRIVPTVEATSTNGVLQPTPATISQFFAAIGVTPPQQLLGAIGPEFFLGFHVVDTNAPLLVIPVTSYDHAFAGMLAWEANMDADLRRYSTQYP